MHYRHFGNQIQMTLSHGLVTFSTMTSLSIRFQFGLNSTKEIIQNDGMDIHVLKHGPIMIGLNLDVELSTIGRLNRFQCHVVNRQSYTEMNNTDGL